MDLRTLFSNKKVEMKNKREKLLGRKEIWKKVKIHLDNKTFS